MGGRKRIAENDHTQGRRQRQRRNLVVPAWGEHDPWDVVYSFLPLSELWRLHFVGAFFYHTVAAFVERHNDWSSLMCYQGRMPPSFVPKQWPVRWDFFTGPSLRQLELLATKFPNNVHWRFLGKSGTPIASPAYEDRTVEILRASWKAAPSKEATTFDGAKRLILYFHRGEAISLNTSASVWFDASQLNPPNYLAGAILTVKLDNFADVHLRTHVIQPQSFRFQFGRTGHRIPIDKPIHVTVHCDWPDHRCMNHLSLVFHPNTPVNIHFKGSGSMPATIVYCIDTKGGTDEPHLEGVTVSKDLVTKPEDAKVMVYSGVGGGVYTISNARVCLCD